jgi:DNA-binding MarR family transcriptional regulator
MRHRPDPLPQATLAAVQRCTCFNLRKAARAVTQYYDEVLRPSGLRTTQFSLLMVLRAAGPLRLTDLAEQAVMDRTTLKRNLELLQRERLVRIQPGADARVREVSLTDAARRRLDAALPLWEQAHAEVTGRLGRARQERLLADLSAAVEAARPAG